MANSQDKNMESHPNVNRNEYLISEYNILGKLIIASDEGIDRLLAIFITIASAPIAILALVSSYKIDKFLSYSWLYGIFLILIGVLCFILMREVIARRFVFIRYMRAMNLIRGYFSRATAIPKSVLGLPTTGNIPVYRKNPRTGWLIALLNTVGGFYFAGGIAFLFWKKLQGCFPQRLLLFLVSFLVYLGLSFAIFWREVKQIEEKEYPISEVLEEK